MGVIAKMKVCNDLQVERMDGWTDGRMDGWTDGRMYQKVKMSYNKYRFSTCSNAKKNSL